MRAGASVALSGLAGATSSIPIAIIVKPYVVAFAGWQAQRGYNTDSVWVDAVTQLVVIVLGGVGMWLRMRALGHQEGGGQ